MRITEFKSGIFEKQYKYESFLPVSINRQWKIDSDKIIAKLSEADRIVGALSERTKLIPDVDKFIGMHIAKEASQSTKIEGTQTEFAEIFRKKEFIPKERRNDWQEVQNYIRAINESIAKLEKLPISTKLICDAHKILLEDTKDGHKAPGEYRKTQNWIGGSSLKDAYYIPPSSEKVSELMADLEKFVNNKKLNIPELVKIAIVHYQFETIHPFLDGNGRIGRLLITLSLVSSGLLNKPSLYLSDFFERNRIDYYDSLTRVRIQNDLENWIIFFLTGIIEVCNNSLDVFDKVLKLKEDIEKNKIIQLSKPKMINAYKLMELLYKQPTVKINDVSNFLNIKFDTAKTLIKDFVKLKILVDITSSERKQVFEFSDYLVALTPKHIKEKKKINSRK